MRLIFVLSESANDLRKYPKGYWCARTDRGGYDGAGVDPLTAISELATHLEEALEEATEMHE